MLSVDSENTVNFGDQGIFVFLEMISKLWQN